MIAANTIAVLDERPAASAPRARGRPDAGRRPRGPGRTTAAAVPKVGRLPWPMQAFLLSLLLPPETNFYLGDFALSPQRLLLIVAGAPAAYATLVRQARSVTAVDVLLVLHVAWAAMTFVVHHGAAQGFKSGGAYVLEVLGSYLLARRYVADAATLRAFIRLLTRIVVLLPLVTIPEVLTGRNPIREGFGALLHAVPFDGQGDRRFGLTRSYGPFPHPILCGVFCSGALALAFYGHPQAGRSALRTAARCVAIAVSAATSISSGALLSVVIQAALITWDRVMRRVRRRWWWLVALVLAAYLGIDALSNRDPITVFISYATLNPQTGYDRKLIWDFGSADVLRHPLIGIGFADWVRPEWMYNSSIDNFWLLVAVRHGLPAAAFIVVAVAVALWRVSRGPAAPAGLWGLRTAWIVAMLSLSIAAATVHLWGSALTFYSALLGCGACLVAGPGRRPVTRGRPRVHGGSPT